MKGFAMDLEELKIKPGDPVSATHLNKIIDAIIENRKYGSDLMEDHLEEHHRDMNDERASYESPESSEFENNRARVLSALPDLGDISEMELYEKSQEEISLEQPTFDRIIKVLTEEGVIYSPRSGRYSKTV